MQINLHKTAKYLIKVLPYIAIIILSLVLFKQCEENKTLHSSSLKTENEIKFYKLENGNLVASQEVLKADKKTLEKQVIEKDTELKQMASKFSKFSSLQKIKTKTTIPSIGIAFEEPIKPSTCDSVSEFTFSRSGAVFTDWYELGYEVTQDSLTIEPFSTWTDIKRIDGFKRKWLLGKKSYHSDIVFTNPYIEIESMQTYKVDVPVRWYETTFLKVLVGFGLGALIVK
jgi:hypothetical protein